MKTNAHNTLPALLAEAKKRLDEPRVAYLKEELGASLSKIEIRIGELSLTSEELDSTVDLEEKSNIEDRIYEAISSFESIYKGIGEEASWAHRSNQKTLEFFQGFVDNVDQVSIEILDKINTLLPTNTEQIKSDFLNWYNIYQRQHAREKVASKIAEYVDIKQYLVGVLRMADMSSQDIHDIIRGAVANS